MRVVVTICVLSLIVALLVTMQVTPAQAPSLAEQLAATNARLAAIQQRSSRIRDINEIENLQRIYGYYTDKMLWDQVVDLFTEDGTLEIGLSGVYVGKDSLRRYLYSLSDGRQGPIEGVLYEHLQLQSIITVSDDGQSADGRWRDLIQTGTYGAGSGGQWGEGPYENEYVKENGVWKINKLHWYATFIAPYEGGWLKVSEDAVRDYSVGKGVMPDRPTSDDYPSYPAASIPPFHFANPVTGDPWKPDP
ncbi:MAG: hypothetical protein HW386_244 [Gammaproteobacteria bacterium]|nr:hypothetical protein [Gammaproteobacteria bacterium]